MNTRERSVLVNMRILSMNSVDGRVGLGWQAGRAVWYLKLRWTAKPRNSRPPSLRVQTLIYAATVLFLFLSTTICDPSTAVYQRRVTEPAKTLRRHSETFRPPMAQLSLQQQSRSFSGYMRQLTAHMRRMLRTAQAQGYSQDQLRGPCQIRASTLRARADEIERMA